MYAEMDQFANWRRGIRLGRSYIEYVRPQSPSLERWTRIYVTDSNFHGKGSIQY